MNEHASIEQILLDSKTAAQSLGICERHFLALERSGRIGPLPITLGRSVRWSACELRAWARHGALPREQYLREEGRA